MEGRSSRSDARFQVNGDKAESTIQCLENDLHRCKSQLKSMIKMMDEKNRLLNAYDHYLTVNDDTHVSERHEHPYTLRDHDTDLHKRSSLTKQCTRQRHREKQHQRILYNCIRFGRIASPSEPIVANNSTDERVEQQKIRLGRCISVRSSSLSNRASSTHTCPKALFIGKRPPTPPQRLQSPSFLVPQSSTVQVNARGSR